MHKKIDQIRKLEGSTKIIKNLFSKKEIDKFLVVQNFEPVLKLF